MSHNDILAIESLGEAIKRFPLPYWVALFYLIVIFYNCLNNHIIIIAEPTMIFGVWGVGNIRKITADTYPGCIDDRDAVGPQQDPHR